MEIQLLDCTLIDMPKTDASKRTFNKEFALELAASMKVEGMYCPVVLRPNPAKPDRFIMVQGRHRLYSWWKILKNTHIEAVVLVDMDEVDASMAAVAENLWRNPLTQKQHLIATKDWFDYFAAKNPSKIGSGGARNFKKAEVAKAAEVAEATSAVVADTELAKEEPSEDSAGTGSFATMYSKVTGKGSTAGDTVTAIMKAFDKDQLEVLNASDVTQQDKLAVAKVKDVEKRGEVVNLIASGMLTTDALKEVLGDAAPVVKTGKGKAEAEAKAAAKGETQETLTDDEWYELNCGEKGRMFKKPTRYRADAILYRQCAEARYAFRGKCKKAIAKVKSAGENGPLTNLFNRFISLAHPKDWLICEVCKGTGDSPKGGVCEKCYGCGFSLKTENYL